MRRRGGNYYANAHLLRADGRRFGLQTARQAPTLRAACRTLDDLEHDEFTGRGYVQLWVEHEQKRRIVAERDEAGNWWTPNPYTGSLDPLDPYESRTPASAGAR